MISYALPPCPDLACREATYVFRSNSFNEEEIKQIVDLGERYLRLQPASTLGDNGVPNHSVRNSDVSWITLGPDTQWIYDRIGWIVRELNGQFFQFDLFGFTEELQYTVYEGNADPSECGHYTWHVDKGNAVQAPRKLSVVIQLSDPSEYEGGNLELLLGSQPLVLKKQQGLLYTFPSYTLHRVTPVTAGKRRTLVVWLTGPKFK